MISDKTSHKEKEMNFIAPKDIVLKLNKFGPNLTGREELAELESSGFPVGDHARQMLLSEGKGSYDDVHRLVQGESYGIVLLPGTCIPRDRNRTTINLRTEAIERFGYYSSLAGAVPYVCEPAFCQYMDNIGFRDIVFLHEPIHAADPSSYVFKIMCFERMLSSSPGHPYFLWDCEVLFAFFSIHEG